MHDIIAKNFRRQAQSDLMRFFLLKEHGGVWLEFENEDRIDEDFIDPSWIQNKDK